MANEEALRTQLSELNARSRWYASQLWQVPFAYIGFSSFAISSIARNYPAGLGWAAALAAIGGFLTLLHMMGVNRGLKNAVSHIQTVERKLELDCTAMHRRGTQGPLRIFLIIVTVSFAAISISQLDLFSHLISLNDDVQRELHQNAS